MKTMEKLNVQILILLTIVSFSDQRIIFDNIFTKADFYRARQQIEDQENRIKIGGNLRLTPKENQVNNILMTFKRREIDEAYLSGKPFIPSTHFFRAKPFIDRSRVLQIIRLMPKGGAIHIHDIGFTDLTWVVKNVTYRNNPLYLCTDKNKKLSFKYFVDYNPPPDPDCPWKLLTAERSKSNNVDVFDARIKKSLSLLVDNPEKVYPTQAAAWEVLRLIFPNTINILALRSVFEDYLYEGFRQFYADNVQYVELRSGLPEVFDSNGKKFDQGQVVQMIKDVADRFARDHPGFFGTKLIFTGLRTADNNKILQDVRKSINFLHAFPDFFAGYDMIILNEDASPPISDVLEALLYPRTLKPPVNLPYFFHADWQDLTSDNNIITAIVLNTTRIAHGFTLMKHPIVKDLMRRSGKAVEMNPISHQTLALINDQRDHPASYLIAEGFPLVIGCDAPSMWDALPLSHDYYVTFMTHSGRDGDIRVLKQLYLNSLQYSSLSDGEKRRAIALWRRRWDQFLDDVIRLYGKPKRRY